ncbi:MAG: zinc ribbon domain-containing protein [Clostridia bacterium]|nr:zinc ribbon domain-containing protein [Clostridia bacterium]
MKRSFLKTMIKTAVITAGLLLLIAGSVNPAVFFLGHETTASVDYILTEESDGNYSTNVDYHYYTSSGKEFSGNATLAGKQDEGFPSKLHPVKYLPLIPSCSVFLTGYTLPFRSILFIASGLFFVITGIFIKTYKKEKATPVQGEIEFICPACECEIDKDSIFCNYCGQKIITKG